MAPDTQHGLRAEAWSDGALRDAALGRIYTPDSLSTWVAEELHKRLEGPSAIWDIACGDGALLKAVHIIEPRHALSGVDIDGPAVARAGLALHDANLVVRDALIPGEGETPSTDLVAAVGGSRPSAMILNPPWGAQVNATPRSLRSLGYCTAVGQFDTYDLFVELSVELLRPGGIGAFILPDSLLNVEHLPLRRLLLARTTVEMIARLGEGFFPSVCRGVVVLVVRNERAAASHQVACLRLSPSERRQVLQGQVSLREIAAQTSHLVPQAWFSRNDQLRFELDVHEGERVHLQRFEIADRLKWREQLVSSRGVEISKHGHVTRCPNCGSATPTPRPPRAVACGVCKSEYSSADAEQEIVVRDLGEIREDDTWKPLIAGQDVRRYHAYPSRLLRLDVPGLAYKNPESFQGDKLLIRKTGVGLNAAVDRSGALTTQVVYHYKRLPNTPVSFILDYLAGILNSRFMLAYHLRTRGDSEWRSHPYITQRVIEELPVPQVVIGTDRHVIARKLGEAARSLGNGTAHDVRRELQVESLVAALYGFDSTDWRWALRVLDTAESLEGIRNVRLPTSTLLSDIA